MGPSGVCLSKDEKFALIADPLSFQVRKLNLKTLELSTFLGTGKRGRTTEPANARKVNLSGPTAVTRDENGTIKNERLYVKCTCQTSTVKQLNANVQHKLLGCSVLKV
eukprot:m.306006 g.306006  ORF g.306006 m.306006 type:complete len:108 (+) comp16344_c1_seq9:893-1216(+)